MNDSLGTIVDNFPTTHTVFIKFIHILEPHLRASLLEYGILVKLLLNYLGACGKLPMFKVESTKFQNTILRAAELTLDGMIDGL